MKKYLQNSNQNLNSTKKTRKFLKIKSTKKNSKTVCNNSYTNTKYIRI